MEQDFHGDLQVNLTWLFAFFSGVLEWIVLILVQFERYLFTLPKLADKVGRACLNWWRHEG